MEHRGPRFPDGRAHVALRNVFLVGTFKKHVSEYVTLPRKADVSALYQT